MANNTIDQQFVEYIVKSLVSKPDAVKVERRIDEKGVLLELTVDGEDLGRVIGKRGATAQSLRTLLRALGTKNDARYNLKIVDTGDGFSREDAAPRLEHQSKDEPEASSEEEPAEEIDTEQAEPAEAESDVVSKTRAELDDLDDLDI